MICLHDRQHPSRWDAFLSTELSAMLSQQHVYLSRTHGPHHAVASTVWPPLRKIAFRIQHDQPRYSARSHVRLLALPSSSSSRSSCHTLLHHLPGALYGGYREHLHHATIPRLLPLPPVTSARITPPRPHHRHISSAATRRRDLSGLLLGHWATSARRRHTTRSISPTFASTSAHCRF